MPGLSCTQNGYALQFVSEALREDEEVVLAALGHGFQAMNFAAPSLKANARVCLAAVNQNGR